MSLRPGPVVGLDIGTSAVRAAQVAEGRGSRRLLRFAQMPLPAGAVVDGEVRDPGPIAEAVAELWKRAKLGSKKAVVGVSNQRVVVRQVDMPFLEEKEFRASLQYQIADHIPMPVEDAQLDARILGDYENDDGHFMRVLVVAAATDMVEGFLTVMSAAGIEPVGVDLTAFAATRAVSPAARGENGLPGSEAVVDIGAGVTTVLIHQSAEPVFVRMLLLGGDVATDALAKELSVSFEEAEAIKLNIEEAVTVPAPAASSNVSSVMTNPTPGAAAKDSTRVIASHVDSLVGEIRGSLDYFLSQEGSEPLVSVVLTGGGSLVPGLVSALEDSLDVQVARGNALEGLDVEGSGLMADQAEQVAHVAAAAVGLSMGRRAKR
ncbi:type IV pilus assembly protein PilM [soil metagenome]